MPFQGDRRRLVLVFVIALGFAFWNLCDEMYIIRTYLLLMQLFLAWALAPFLVLILGLLSKNSSVTRASLIWECVHMSVFLLYALNGSTRGRMGAGHMHLFIIPILLSIPAVFVLVGCVISSINKTD
jgi:hypothetical protein